MSIRATIQNALDTLDSTVESALIKLHNRQTQREQAIKSAIYKNDLGFSKKDAKQMSVMAVQVKSGQHLTPEQLAFLRGGRSERFHSRIGKYWRQVADEVEPQYVLEAIDAFNVEEEFGTQYNVSSTADLPPIHA